MKLVMTGSESFIGRELKRHCRDRGIGWIGIDTAPSEDAGHVIMDIRAADIEGAIPWDVDAVVHLAAISRDQDCRSDPRLAVDVNVGGTLNLIRAARARRVRQFVFASSEWVYGEVGNRDVQTEDSVINAGAILSEYALTKLMGERILSMASQRGFCPVTVLRFGIVYGPRPKNWSAVESIFNAIRTEGAVEVKGSLRTARRFIHVSDVADGILSVLGRSGYEVFNLSGNTLISLGDVIEESAQLLRRQPRVIERDPAAVSIRNPDNQKARARLGWEPTVGLREGLMTLLSEAGETACRQS